MSVLICGGAGYIGSHINKELSRRGYDTVVLDNLIYGHREAVKWGKFVFGDMASLADIERAFDEAPTPVEAVLDFAAFAYVGESVTEPEKYYYNNVANTLNLLQVMRRRGCNKIVFSSTCATYGEPDKVPITEDMPQNPINPYGASKLMVERIFKDYGRAYGLKFAVLRYFNAAGADPDCEIGESHDPETHLIPLVLEAAMGKRDHIKVFGNDYPTPDGSCVRDYIHVTDLADAHARALVHLKNGGDSVFLNMGNTQGTSVLQVIESVKRVTQKSFDVVMSARREGDPAVLVGSSETARKTLGWEPKLGEIDEIVKTAWEWHCNREY